VFARALDLGVNHFDTAPSYQGGNNETMVRAGIAGRRREVVLSTKTEASTKDEALRQLERSLKEFGTDYIDIWYLHGKDSVEALKPELLEAQAIAKQQGKVRFIGVSTHRLPQVASAILKNGKVDVVMAAYNFTMDSTVEQSAASLHAAGIGLVDMKAMAGGKINPRWPGNPGLPQAFDRAGARGAALRWVLRNKMFASALVGMLSVDEVEENWRSAAAGFNQEDQRLLAERLPLIREVYCRMCGHCEGECPRGLPVSDLLRLVMYADNYGQFRCARDDFQKLPQSVKQVKCADCATCAVSCPNGVRVKDRLVLGQTWLA
jgi:hypothetical protein